MTEVDNRGNSRDAICHFSISEINFRCVLLSSTRNIFAGDLLLFENDEIIQKDIIFLNRKRFSLISKILYFEQRIKIQ